MRSASVRDHTARGESNEMWNRPVSRLCVASFLAIVAGINAASTAAPQRVENAPLISCLPDPEDEEEKWIEQFMEILRRLYEALGGDPSKLGNSPELGMLNVTIQVAMYGVPGGLTPSQTSAILADVETLATMLGNPPSSVDPGGFGFVLAEIVSSLS